MVSLPPILKRSPQLGKTDTVDTVVIHYVLPLALGRETLFLVSGEEKF
jgi:hypothetical protein